MRLTQGMFGWMILMLLSVTGSAAAHGNKGARHPHWPFGHRRSVDWFEAHWSRQHEAITEELDEEREYIFHGMSSGNLRRMRKRGAFGGTDRLFHLADQVRLRHMREYEEE